MFRYWKRPLAFVLMFLLLITSAPLTPGVGGPAFAGAAIPHVANVEAYKHWTLPLSQPLKPEAAYRGVLIERLSDQGKALETIHNRLLTEDAKQTLTIMYPESGYLPGERYRITLRPELAEKIRDLPSGACQFEFTISEDPKLNKKPAALASNVYFFSGQQAKSALEEIGAYQMTPEGLGKLVLSAAYATRRQLTSKGLNFADSLYQLGEGEIFWIDNPEVPLGAMTGKIVKIDENKDGSRTLSFSPPAVEELFSEMDYTSKKALTAADLIDKQLPEGASLEFKAQDPLEADAVGGVLTLPSLVLEIPEMSIADAVQQIPLSARAEDGYAELEANDTITLGAKLSLEDPTADVSFNFKKFSWKPFGRTVIPEIPYGVNSAKMRFAAKTEQVLKIDANFEDLGYGLADKLDQDNKHKLDIDSEHFEGYLYGADMGKRAILANATFALDTMRVSVKGGPPETTVNLGLTVLFTVTLHGSLNADIGIELSNASTVDVGFEYSSGKVSKTKETKIDSDPELKIYATGEAEFDFGIGVGAGVVFAGVIVGLVTADFYEQIDFTGYFYMRKKPSADIDDMLGKVDMTLSTHLRSDVTVGLGLGVEASIKIWWIKLKIEKKWEVYATQKPLLDVTFDGLTRHYDPVAFGGVPEEMWVCEYYGDAVPGGDMLTAQFTDAIGFNWGDSAPGRLDVDEDFSAIWKGKFNFEEGLYLFVFGFSRKARILIDDVVYFDNLYAEDALSAFNSFEIEMSEGTHEVVVEASFFMDDVIAQTNQDDRIAYLEWGKAEDGFFGRYYNGSSKAEVANQISTDLGRSYARFENLVDMESDKPSQGPAAGISPVFGAVWEKQGGLMGGEYELMLGIDTGSDFSLLIDGQNAFQGVTGQVSGNMVFYSAKKQLTEGNHSIKLAYVGDGGRSSLRFYYGVPPKNEFAAFYYSNQELGGVPSNISYEKTIDHDWGNGSPSNVSADFSAIYKGDFYLEGGNYLFTVRADDLVEVSVDGKTGDQAVIRNWNQYDPSVLFNTVDLETGWHRIEVRYRETGGPGHLQVHFERTNDKFIAEYKSGTYTGRVAVEAKIDHYWGTGNPDGVGADNFQVYWTGDIAFEAGVYYFNAYADDTIRIYVDQKEVLFQNHFIERWSSTDPVTLTEGKHRITVQYAEGEQNAIAKVNWVKASEDDVWLAKFYYTDSMTTLTSWATSGQRPDYVAVFDHFEHGTRDNETPFPGDFTTRAYGVAMSGNHKFEAGQYVLAGLADDRMDVYMDGGYLFTTQYNNGAGFQFIDKRISGGSHHFDAYGINTGGASDFYLIWLPKGDNTFTGRYYNTTNWSNGAKLLEVTETPSLSFHWGSDGPKAGNDEYGESVSINTDNFSGIYEGDFDFEGAFYRFRLRADDFARITIDGKLVLPGTGGRDNVVWMSRGSHHIKVEYIELGGNAGLEMNWEKAQANTFYATFHNGSDSSSSFVLHEKTVMPAQDPDDPTHFSLSESWGTGSPGGSTDSDHFNAMYTGVFDFEAGDYVFNMTADDQAVLYIDGVEQARAKYDAIGGQAVTLTAGRHLITLEHKEGVGGANLGLDWRKVQSNSFAATYFNNTSRSGTPVKAEAVSGTSLDFSWGTGSPAQVSSDNFSAIYQGDFDFTEGYYCFSTRPDDWAKLTIDGRVILEGRGSDQVWHMSAGSHRIKLEFAEDYGSAQIKFNWSPVSVNQFKATYYESDYPSGNFVKAKETLTAGPGAHPGEMKLSQDWGSGSPATVRSDNFSAYFSGLIETEAGTYTFKHDSDDRLALYVDGNLVSDYAAGGQTSVALSAGLHTLDLRYREFGGVAHFNLTWVKQ